ESEWRTPILIGSLPCAVMMLGRPPSAASPAPAARLPLRKSLREYAAMTSPSVFRRGACVGPPSPDARAEDPRGHFPSALHAAAMPRRGRRCPRSGAVIARGIPKEKYANSLTTPGLAPSELPKSEADPR